MARSPLNEWHAQITNGHVRRARSFRLRLCENNFHLRANVGSSSAFNKDTNS
jgi:hypothetical protein